VRWLARLPITLFSCGNGGLLLVVPAEADHREVPPQGLAGDEDPGRHLALGVAGEGRADHAERPGRHLHRIMRNPGPNHATDYLKLTVRRVAGFQEKKMKNWLIREKILASGPAIDQL
jgi:hypothetical protein